MIVSPSTKYHFRILHMELDPQNVISTLPGLFYRKYRQELGTQLRFIDHQGSVFVIILEKGLRTGYIVGGLKELMEFYNIEVGGWLKLWYAGGNMFYIKVKDGNMSPITYSEETAEIPGQMMLPFLTSSFMSPEEEIGQSIVGNGFPCDDVLFESASHPLEPSGTNFNEYIDSDDIFCHSIPNGLTESLDSCEVGLQFELDNFIQPMDEPMDDADLGVCFGHLTQMDGVDFCEEPFFICHPPQIDEEVNSLAAVVDYVGIDGELPNQDLMDVVVDYQAQVDALDIGVAQHDNNRNGGCEAFKDQKPVAIVVCEKHITAYQSQSHSLVLPAAFVAKAFRSRPTSLVVRDDNGNTYDMELRWGTKRLTEVYLTKGWKQFAMDHNLADGSVVVFRVFSDEEQVVIANVLND